MSDLRHLPSVENLLNTKMAVDLVSAFGRQLTVESIRSVLEHIRTGFRDGDTVPGADEILKMTVSNLEQKSLFTLKEVINASGVILHTNLGRAPLGRAAIEAIQSVSSGYSNLEYDLKSGKRGSRTVHAESLLVHLTGAESALVVNNNAAAVLLCLTALAKRRSVVISRSQLVEIGGGFRIPDVMKQSGAKLIEVGTTNRVHIRDYQEALQNSAVMVFHAHHSNFQLVGFTSEPKLSELSAVAKEHQVIFMDDLGSGALIATEQFGLSHEPTVQESLTAGADIVCFSGDKLLGGPQAGIIVGRADLIKKIKKHPLARAVRADKLCLGALSATLWQYAKGTYIEEIPIWSMMSKDIHHIQEKAFQWQRTLGYGEVVKGFSTIGGGSMPGEEIPTYLLSMSVKKPDMFQKLLRDAKPAIIARIEDDLVLFDPRTILPELEEVFLKGLFLKMKEFAII